VPEEGTKKADALFADHPQQPLDVVAGCTQHGMDRIPAVRVKVVVP